MKIIEALKELPVLEKRIARNNEQIKEYAGLPSWETSPFGGAGLQTDKVQSLVQSNLDLIDRHSKLTLALAITNTQVKVDIGGEVKTITEWIAFRRKTYALMKSTFDSLDVSAAIERAGRPKVELTEGVKVERMFSEENKLKSLERIRAIRDLVDGTLEVVNATTDLTVEVR